MEIPINLNPDKISEFLDYLQVEIKAKGSWSGHGSFNDKGQLVERVLWSVSDPAYENGKIVLIVTWKPDGTLEPINANIEGKVPNIWEELVGRTIQQALVSTINAKRNRYFFRYIYAYMGPPLDGEYYIAGFRIAPAIYPDNRDPIGERILYLDRYEKGIDEFQVIPIGKVHADQITALLSVFLGIGIYSIPCERRWVYIDSDSCQRHQLGFSSSMPTPKKMPKKGKECSPGKFRLADRDKIESPYFASQLQCPDNIRHLFCSFYNLSSEERKAYLGAVSLYQIALTAGRYYPTVKMSYQIAAVDVLTQRKGHTQASFEDLIKEYCPEAPSHFGSKIYGEIRSAHFHSGFLPGGEYEPIGAKLFIGHKTLNRMSLNHAVHIVTHTVLIRWLLSRYSS